ncbi:MAG TPA: pyridoxal-phosphate dependent enzyme [Chitinophagaceae bacterium]|nr:pyridoxal-phosphate dependent enzyme [Chitinophagaceae bacterium]
MWQYEKLLLPVAAGNRVSLGEGNTPLVRSRAIGPALGLKNLYFKLESLNPSGSYKDRFASAFISQMKSKNQGLCIATSSGNTGAALSAYSAAAGIRCVLVIVDGAPVPKIRQMQLYGAHTIMVEGFGKDASVTSEVFDQLNKLAGSFGVPLPVSAFMYCSDGMQGVQSLMYELMEAIPVDHVFSPAGGGGLTLAMAYGANKYADHYNRSKKPKVNCVQPEGNDTIASALRNGDTSGTIIAKATTKISGLQVPNILDGNEVIRECRMLGGNGYVVSDESVFELQKKLAQSEGIFSEPAGAVALAGLVKAVGAGEVGEDDHIVCLVTGSGFKDMLSVENNFNLPDIGMISPAEVSNSIREINIKHP